MVPYLHDNLDKLQLYLYHDDPEVNTPPFMYEVASSNPGKWLSVFFNSRYFLSLSWISLISVKESIVTKLGLIQHLGTCT